MLWLWETVLVVAHLWNGYFPFALQTFHLFLICSVPEEADNCMKGFLFPWRSVEFGQWGSLARDWRKGGNWGQGVYFLSTFPARSPRLRCPSAWGNSPGQVALSNSYSHTPQDPVTSPSLEPSYIGMVTVPTVASLTILVSIAHPRSQLLSQAPPSSVPSICCQEPDLYNCTYL